MNQKERAINLGLKINSLKGNFSVAKSVITDLGKEIESAVIDEEDRKRLLTLYNNVTEELKSIVSPSTERKGFFNQRVEDLLRDINSTKSYLEEDAIDGLLICLEEDLARDKILKKEHKAAITHRISKLREKHKAKVGQFLKKNFEKLFRDIKKEFDCENPFHISVLIKKYNEVVKKTPMFFDDRHTIQAYLDTMWQKSSVDIKEIKRIERD